MKKSTQREEGRRGEWKEAGAYFGIGAFPSRSFLLSLLCDLLFPLCSL